MRRVRHPGVRIAAWAGVVLLGASSVLLQPPARFEDRPPVLALLGPLRELASNVQWIRFQEARLAGEQALALGHAESALELAPEATAGWELLAAHLGFFLSSAEREPSVEARRAWFRAAIEVTRRGQERADEPGELALLRGVLFLNKAELDPAVWPAGRAGLLEEARAAFEEARRLGVPEARAFSDYVGLEDTPAGDGGD